MKPTVRWHRGYAGYRVYLMDGNWVSRIGTVEYGWPKMDNESAAIRVLDLADKIKTESTPSREPSR